MNPDSFSRFAMITSALPWGQPVHEFTRPNFETKEEKMYTSNYIFEKMISNTRIHLFGMFHDIDLDNMRLVLKEVKNLRFEDMRDGVGLRLQTADVIQQGKRIFCNSTLFSDKNVVVATGYFIFEIEVKK